MSGASLGLGGEEGLGTWLAGTRDYALPQSNPSCTRCACCAWLACSEGGTSIEDLAEKFPDKIIKIPIDIRTGITDEQAMQVLQTSFGNEGGGWGVGGAGIGVGGLGGAVPLFVYMMVTSLRWRGSFSESGRLSCSSYAAARTWEALAAAPPDRC